MAAFAAFGSGIESQIAGIAESTSTSLISSIYPIIVIALTIYFIARAWSIMLGSRDSLGGLILTCVKIGFIAWIGLSSGRSAVYRDWKIFSSQPFQTPPRAHGPRSTGSGNRPRKA